MAGMGYDGLNVSHNSQNTRKMRECNTRIADITQGEGENMAELNAGAVLDRMQEVADVRTDIALGKYFGLGTSAVSGWRARNKVPYEECVILAKRKGVSLDWLLLGVGTMDGSNDYRVHDDDPTDDHIKRMVSFLGLWSLSRSDDEKVWLEMQLARAVPEYAEWLAARKK
jgi:hypothetical protein